MVIFQKIADKDIMEKAIREYTHWAARPLPKDLQDELEAIKGNETAIYDRFCKDLTFGTSGLRGKMGVGSNMINSIVLKRATDGVVDYLLSRYTKPEVIVSYDTRINSMEYAEVVAKELAKGGVAVRIFAEPTPVPVLSFAIRELKVNGGIMITASHNPKEYNGYKVYDHCGNQIDDAKARLIESYISEKPYFERKLQYAADSAEIKILDNQVKNAYLKALGQQLLFWTDEEKARKSLSELSVVYTPLNGAGRDYVMEVTKSLGIRKIKLVEEQGFWDGRFPTCPSPNPEYDEAFQVALDKYCDEKTDIIVATDPDSDRMGVMARQRKPLEREQGQGKASLEKKEQEPAGTFKRLTGNQAGVLMLDYICYCHQKNVCGRTLNGDKVAYKSHVSSPLTEDIAEYYGIQIKNVPTGFKNIAAEIENLKKQGREDDFLFGFEESLGYLYGNYTRDKDGALAVQMICLMAACLKEQGKTLFDKLEEIYARHGYVTSSVKSFYLKTEMDRKKIDELMDGLFSRKLRFLMGERVKHDLSHRDINMYRAVLPEGHQIIIRPSGTEMKVKVYAYAKGDSEQEAQQNVQALIEESEKFVRRYF